MLTAIVLAKNEEKGIEECLETLSFADRRILIDDFSTDRTRARARRLGVRVYKRHLENNFAAQRNFALRKALPGWVLFIDADERVTAALQLEIVRTIKDRSKPFSGYLISRQDWLFGKRLKYGETNKVKLLRLAKKSAGSWQRRVHEVWEIDGKVSELSASLKHLPHQTVSNFATEINRYSDLHALAIRKEGKRATFAKVILFPAGKFLQNYIVRLGFLDGMPGLVVALMMSLHSFLAWGKLYFLQKESQE